MSAKPGPARGLKFTESTHRYTLDGRPVPGVTTLIGGGVPKPSLTYWAAKSVAEYVVGNLEDVTSLIESTSDKPWEAINHLKGIPWKARDIAAVRGSEIHALAEEIIHGREVDVPDTLLPHVEGYVRFLEDFAVEPVLTERRVANRTWFYAGTFDAIVKMGRGPWAGETVLVDWKSSKSVYGDTSLQCASYAMAEFYQDGDDELPMPIIDHIGVVHLTEKGSYLYDLGDIGKAFKEFCSAAYIAKTTDRRNKLIGDPLTADMEIPA